MILNTLIYDGKVEKTIASDGSNLYRAIRPLLDSSGLVKSPCGICPVSYNMNFTIFKEDNIERPCARST
jgi:DNA-directed RNA polymerase III subunit RPC6